MDTPGTIFGTTGPTADQQKVEQQRQAAIESQKRLDADPLLKELMQPGDIFKASRAFKKAAEQNEGKGPTDGNTGLTTILKPLTDAVQSAVSPTQNNLTDNLIQGGARSKITFTALTELGAIAKLGPIVGFPAGFVFGKLVDAQPANTIEEQQIADLAARYDEQKKKQDAAAPEKDGVKMMPVWRADP